jgi:hypothetical protein
LFWGIKRKRGNKVASDNDHQINEEKLSTEKMDVNEPEKTSSKDDKMVKSGVQTTLYSKPRDRSSYRN